VEYLSTINHSATVIVVSDRIYVHNDVRPDNPDYTPSLITDDIDTIDCSVLTTLSPFVNQKLLDIARWSTNNESHKISYLGFEAFAPVAHESEHWLFENHYLGSSSKVFTDISQYENADFHDHRAAVDEVIVSLVEAHSSDIILHTVNKPALSLLLSTIDYWENIMVVDCAHLKQKYITEHHAYSVVVLYNLPANQPDIHLELVEYFRQRSHHPYVVIVDSSEDSPLLQVDDMTEVSLESFLFESNQISLYYLALISVTCASDTQFTHALLDSTYYSEFFSRFLALDDITAFSDVNKYSLRNAICYPDLMSELDVAIRKQLALMNRKELEELTNASRVAETSEAETNEFSTLQKEVKHLTRELIMKKLLNKKVYLDVAVEYRKRHPAELNLSKCLKDFKALAGNPFTDWDEEDRYKYFLKRLSTDGWKPDNKSAPEYSNLQDLQFILEELKNRIPKS
jgi:hypothetical protein